MKKRFFDVYIRRTTTKYGSTAVDTSSEIANLILDEVDGATNATNATCWNRIGDITAGGIVGLNAGAFLRGEKGDSQELANGNKPVISENIISEFQSFDVDQTSWSDAATGGDANGMPVRKRFSTNVTGLNVDIAFIDKQLGNESVTNYYAWDVPIHVGISIEANALSQLPITIEREVEDLNDHIDGFTAATT